jgi:hypothetical protein
MEYRANSRAFGKKHSLDDVMSKSTAITDDSTLSPSPLMTYFSRSDGNRQRTTKGTLSISHLNTQSPLLNNRLRKYKLPNRPSSQTDFGQASSPANSQQDSKRTVPVNIPPRKTDDLRDLSLAHHECEDATYLMKVYDARTWEMYRRITEARKDSSYEGANAPTDNSRGDNTSEWENLQHDHLESSRSGHEMIFLFDFD